MDDGGPPRKRLQSDQQAHSDQHSDPAKKRIAELERELTDANKKIAEQGETIRAHSSTIRELTISLEAARRESDLKDTIISEKERIISEKESTIKAQKDESENAANLRMLTAEKKYRDQANHRVREKAEQASRLLDEASQRENLLRQDLQQASRRENNLMRELAKAQNLHLQTKREGKMMFGFLKTGIDAFEHLSQTKSTIADRHGEKITHLKTVGKLLGDEAGTISPFGIQVTREDPESQHLS